MSTELPDSFFIALLDWETTLNAVQGLTQDVPQSELEAAYTLGRVHGLVAGHSGGNNQNALKPLWDYKEARWQQQQEQWRQEAAQRQQEAAIAEEGTATIDAGAPQPTMDQAANKQAVLEALHKVAMLVRTMRLRQDGKSSL